MIWYLRTIYLKRFICQDGYVIFPLLKLGHGSSPFVVTQITYTTSITIDLLVIVVNQHFINLRMLICAALEFLYRSILLIVEFRCRLYKLGK